MAYSKQLRGNARRWYLIPCLLGLGMMLFAWLIVAYPVLFRILVAFPIFMSGLGFFLFGLDVWRGIPRWREKVQVYGQRIWPGDESDPFRD